MKFVTIIPKFLALAIHFLSSTADIILAFPIQKTSILLKIEIFKRIFFQILHDLIKKQILRKNQKFVLAI